VSNDLMSWHDGKGFVLAMLGPVSVNLTSGRLYSAGIVLRNGMHILGVTAPERM